MHSAHVYTLFLLSSACLAFGQASSSDQVSHGMDMNMDTGMQLATGQMLPYLHFQGGDILWFSGWVPGNKGAMTGACIGLFLFAILDRWFAAMRAVAQVSWSKRYFFLYFLRVFSPC